MRKMTVDELIERAHRTARDKGFWTLNDLKEKCEEEWGYKYPEISDALVCQKLALVSTEVREFEEAATRAGGATEAREELADVCIRVFDLLGYFRSGIEDVPVNPYLNAVKPDYFRSYKDLARSLYGEIAGAVDAYRLSQPIVLFAHFDEIIESCDRFAAAYFGVGSLWAEIERKMDANEGRPHLHGKRY
jgi:hypothetical protein